jgi:sugar/nucleoside kinase (ribokinase family)
LARPEILAAGGVTVDNIVTADGRLFLQQPGGNAVHAAVGAAVWGVRCGIAGRLPADYPEAVLAALRASGLDLRALRIEAGTAPLQEWFFHRADGSRVDHLHAAPAEAAAAGILGARLDPAVAAAWEARLAARAPGGRSFAAFRRTHPVLPQTIPDTAWPTHGLHVGPGEPAAMLVLARAGRARGLIVTLDPGFAAARLDHATLAALLDLTSVFLPSEKELRLLCPRLGPTEAVRRLGARARGIVCAKFGAAGALLHDRATGCVRRVPAHPSDAVDPIGAGDAFAGGMLAGLILGDPPARAALRGAASASLAVESVGALAPLAIGAAEAERRLAALIALNGQTEDR